MRKYLHGTLAVLILTIVFRGYSIGDNKKTMILPRHLLQLAEENGYTQIDEFYDKWDTVDPCFVYGYKPSVEWEDKFNSVVFWCRKMDASRDSYFLLFAVVKSVPMVDFEIEEVLEWRDPPGGLALVRDSVLTLDEFYYIDKEGAQGPKGVKLDNFIIRSYDEGVQQDFYKYQGKWLIRQLD